MKLGHKYVHMGELNTQPSSQPGKEEASQIRQSQLTVCGAQLDSWFQGYHINTLLRKVAVETQVPIVIFV